MSVIIKVISVSQDFMDQICELLYFGDLVRSWLIVCRIYHGADLYLIMLSHYN